MPVWNLKTALHSAERFSTSGCGTMAFTKSRQSAHGRLPFQFINGTIFFLFFFFFWSADPHQVGSAGT